MALSALDPREPGFKDATIEVPGDRRVVRDDRASHFRILSGLTGFQMLFVANSSLDDGVDAFHGPHVEKRISGHHDDVGELSDFNGSELFG